MVLKRWSILKKNSLYSKCHFTKNLIKTYYRYSKKLFKKKYSILIRQFILNILRYPVKFETILIWMTFRI